jgi:hypothetical protein
MFLLPRFFCVLCSPASQPPGIQRTQEDGGEVVLNPEAPPSSISVSLNKVFANTGTDDLARLV